MRKDGSECVALGKKSEQPNNGERRRSEGMEQDMPPYLGLIILATAVEQMNLDDAGRILSLFMESTEAFCRASTNIQMQNGRDSV